MLSVSLPFIEAPSPNYDERTLPITHIVLHYTGMESGMAALERMQDADAKVSAHYMIEEDGRIFKLVEEEHRAWHAGLSEWQGETNVNSCSIGIELVNGGHDYGLPDFADVQINALIALCKDIMHRQNVPSQNVIGHSDIAPQRKQDPGEKFPWMSLAAAGIGFWPVHDDVPDRRVLFIPEQRDRGVTILQTGLAYLGYCARVTGVLDSETQDVVKAFQRRYRPALVSNNVDMETMSRLRAVMEAYQSRTS